jgi:hypothetical protein
MADYRNGSSVIIGVGKSSPSLFFYTKLMADFDVNLPLIFDGIQLLYRRSPGNFIE